MKKKILRKENYVTIRLSTCICVYQDYFILVVFKNEIIFLKKNSINIIINQNVIIIREKKKHSTFSWRDMIFAVVVVVIYSKWMFVCLFVVVIYCDDNDGQCNNGWLLLFGWINQWIQTKKNWFFFFLVILTFERRNKWYKYMKRTWLLACLFFFGVCNHGKKCFKFMISISFWKSSWKISHIDCTLNFLCVFFVEKTRFN